MRKYKTWLGIFDPGFRPCTVYHYSPIKDFGHVLLLGEQKTTRVLRNRDFQEIMKRPEILEIKFLPSLAVIDCSRAIEAAVKTI